MEWSARTTMRAFGYWQPKMDGRAAQAVRVCSSALLMVSIGLALSWELRFVVGGAVAMAAATWLANSVTRALWCAFGAIGLLAAAAAAVQALHAPLFATLHIEWRFVAWAWLAMIVLLAAALRRAWQLEPYGVPELVACWTGVIAAGAIAHRLDFSQSLLPYLVNVEDNEAWVGLTTQIHTAAALGPGLNWNGLGPVTPTVLGLLAQFQVSSVPYFNAAFAAYALAVILTPLVVAGLLGRLRHLGALASAVFTVIVFGWAYHVPFFLFASFGHLSATLAFLFLLAAIAILAMEDSVPLTVPIAGGVIFAAGATWFPLIPVAIAALCVVGWIAYRRSGGRERFMVLGLVAVLSVLLAYQGAGMFGLGQGGSFGGIKDGLGAMYASQGGTATLDGVLQVLVLMGLVGASFVSSPLPIFYRLWRCAGAVVAYVALVFAGSYAMKYGLGYGPTKLWFIGGFAAAIVLVAMVPRLRMPPRALVACVVALAMGSFIFGGMGDLLSRTWPGGQTHPVWLAPVTAVAALDQGTATQSLGCFSNDKYAAYFCTRWAAGLTPGGSASFLNYRVQVISEVDPTQEIAGLVAGGDLAHSDLIMLDLPDAAHPWGWTLINNAGRVYGADGTLLDPRPTPPAGS